MVIYIAKKERAVSEDFDVYESYGIYAYRICLWRKVLLAHFKDYSVSRKKAYRLARLCTFSALSPVHLYDVIYDTLG